MPDQRFEPSPYVRLHAGFQLWLVDVAVGTIVGSAWLFRMPQGLSVLTRVYVALALISSVVVLGLLPGALFALANHTIRSGRALAWAHAIVGTCFLGLLYTDTIIYRLLRYHFNGAVLNVAVTPGAGDAIHLGWSVWGPVIAYVGIVSWLHYGAWRLAARRLARREEVGLAPPLLLRPRVVVLLVLFPIVGIEKAGYAAAHAKGDEELMVASRPLPLYPRVRLGRLLDPEGARLPRLEVVPEGSKLAYPAASPVLPPDGRRPNILLIVLDSWRRDMFTAELTPNLHAFSGGARVFEDHVSGGNGTRYGLFTMLYGLHGSYWFHVLEEHQPPAMIEALQAAGYDLRVFSAASMSFPEFRETAWSSLPRERVVDEFLRPGGAPASTVPWVKDGLAAEAFCRWIEERSTSGAAEPFFAFVLLDSPHQPYSSPGGPYRPTIESLNYIELGRTTDGPELAALVERVSNAYRNAVLYADEVAGRLISAIERAGVLEDTIVLVTGDHGEEFQENGFWGHTSNFSPEQIEVPFFLRGPGVEPGSEHRPTSHLDVSNSLLELLGADPRQRGGYSLGESLFDPPADRARVVCGWSHIGLWTESGIFDIPLDLDADEIWVYDRDWRLLPDVAARCAVEEPALERMARECTRFLSGTIDG